MDYENEFDLYYTLANEYYDSFLNENTSWKEIDIDEIKLNDIIIIYYIPDSQKYMFQLYPKFGKVIEMDNNDSNKLNIENIYLTNKQFNYLNASHDCYGLYSRNYTYSIIKLYTK